MASASLTRPSQLRPRRGQEGYVLLYLLLMVALMGIVALAVIVPLKFDLQREREQEMIHRGVQYSRSIRNYYKKFGRYPTRLEDLDNTNNLRYLRKRYKDPLTGKDFKLLHYGDPGLSMSGSIGGGGITGANTVGQMNGSSLGSSPGNSPGNSAFGGSGSGFGQSSSFGGSSSGFGNSSGSSFGSSSNSSFGNSSSSGFGSGFGNSNSSGTSTGGASSTGASSGSSTNQPAGTDASQSGTGTSPDASSTQSGASGQGNNQVFGGGPIVGVASLSKDNTIREFNHKKKYNEWQFVYDPTTDRGGLILTPYQPALQLSAQPLNGQPGSTNTNGNSSPFGQPTGFGNNGFGNNNPASIGGPSAPQQPPSSSSPPQ
jgi:type II secretory pathway pseudopilin PulG